MEPMAFFTSETQNAEAPIRTEAMRRLVVVAAVIGAERARNSLIPYLQTRIGDLDQVLLAMAQKVGDLVPFIGGAEHATALIPVVELLCGSEETIVRTAAAASISQILLHFNNNSACKTQALAYFEMLLRLCNYEEGDIFYSRVTACQFLPELYLVLPAEIKPQLRELYARLFTDEMVIVRRSAAHSFLRLVAHCDAEHRRGDLLAVFKTLASDENAAVRLMALDIVIPYAALLKESSCEDVLSVDLLPLIKAATEDVSWSSRKAICRTYGQLAKSFAASEVTETIFPGLLLLCQDQEPDVRTLAIKEVLAFLDVVGHAPFLSAFVPIAQMLVEDPFADSRKCLTLVCIDVAARVGPEASAQHLSDLVLRLTEDEDPLVRLRVLQRLDMVARETPSLCTRLTEHLKAMLSDPNWRVRKQAALACPAVMQHLGKEYLQDNFLPGLLLLLHDGVDEVRTAATVALPKIAALGGADWAYSTVFPPIRDMAKGDFLVRQSLMTALQGILEAESLAGSTSLQSEALALVVNATNDKVPNVRLRAAQVLGAACVALGPEGSRTSIRPVLAALQQDKDRDVAFFATQSIKSCA